MDYTDRERAAIQFEMLVTLCVKIEISSEKTIDLLKERIADPNSDFSGAFKDTLYGMIYLLQNEGAFDD